MLKVGNEDVKKIMMGNVEIENIAIGDETIPVESGTPAEPKYYIQISGGTKQELSGGTYEGYINVGSSFWIYADDLDISSALTCECDICNSGFPAIYYDTYDNPHHFYAQLPLSALVVTNNTICPVVADVYLNADGATYSVPFQIGEPGVWETDDYLFIPENDIPEDTPITISLDGVNPLEIHWFDQSLEQEMIETAFTSTCVIPAGSYFGFHIEYQPEYSATPYISMDEPLPECGVGPAYIAMYDASVGETTTEELDPNGGTVYYGLTQGSMIEIRKDDADYGEPVDFYWRNDADGMEGVSLSYSVMSSIDEINYDFDAENGRYNIYIYDEPK